MYHGTPYSKFDVFKGEDWEEESSWKYKKTFWFTTDKKLAKSHATKQGGKGNIYEVFLNIRNPKLTESNLYKNEKFDGYIDYNAADNDNWTPLNTATLNGHEDIVRLLLEKVDDINVNELSKTTYKNELNNEEIHQILNNKLITLNIEMYLEKIKKFDINSDNLIEYISSNKWNDYVNVNFSLRNSRSKLIKNGVLNNPNCIEIDTNFYNYCNNSIRRNYCINYQNSLELVMQII
jgi:ankyrin repeat protein